LDEASLVEKAKHGDVEAYATLVGLHQAALFRAAYLFTGDADDAKDVVQDALLKTFRSMGTLGKSQSLRAWMLRIVVNEAKNSNRRESRRRVRELTTLRSDENRRSSTPEAIVLRSEQHAYLLQALHRLSADDQTIVLMRYVLELTESEMTVALGRPRGTVKSRLSRALLKLREELEPDITAPALGAVNE
jgi:RNA polymerase sigma factor (sigma-70 family)